MSIQEEIDNQEGNGKEDETKQEVNSASEKERGWLETHSGKVVVVLVTIYIVGMLYLTAEGSRPDLEEMGYAAGAFALTFVSVVLILAGLVTWIDIKKELEDFDMKYGKDINRKFSEQDAKIEKKFDEQNKKLDELKTMIQNSSNSQQATIKKDIDDRSKEVLNNNLKDITI